MPGLLAAIVGGFAFTQHLITVDLSKVVRPTMTDSAVDGSYYMRTVIVQNAWEGAGKDAGFFGFSDQMDSRRSLGLESVDNSYMLFLIRRGWVHLRLALGVGGAWVAAQMLRNARGHAARTPPAALAASLIGTYAAMYTVWFGFVYAELWTATLAIAVTMYQVLRERQATASPVPSDARRRAVPPALASGRPLVGLRAGRVAH